MSRTDLNPEWALLYTRVLTLQLLRLASCAFSRLNTCCPMSPSVHIPTSSGVKLSFHWTYSRKQGLIGCISGHKRPRAKQTLKPAWIIIIIMPRSVCSHVWQTPQTWAQKWVLQRPETKWIWNTEKKKKKERLKVMFVFLFVECNGLVVF